MRILYVMFFILVLAGIAPWIDGQIVKHNYTELLNAINADSQVTFKITEYRAGWITSRVKVSIEPNSASGMRMPGQSGAVIEQKIMHGPIIFNQNKIIFALALIKANFRAPEMVEAFLLGGKKEGGLMQVETLSNFNGSYTSKITIPIISFQSPFGGLTWQGFKGDMYMEVLRQRMSRFKAELIIGAISVESRKGSFIAEPETYSYDMTRQVNGLWNGSISLSAPSMTFNHLNQSHNLTKFDFSTSFGMDANNFYNILVDSSLDQLKTPHYFVNPAKFKLAINNLSVNGCVEFMSLMSALKSQQISADDLEDQYETLIPRLITPSTNINADMLVSTTAGRMISAAKLFWPKDISASATLEEIANKMNLQANLRISISLVNRIIEIMADKNKSQIVPSILSSAGQAGGAEKKEFDDQIDAWVQQGQVSSYAGDKLKEMRDKHISMEVYATNVDQFVNVNEILPQAASPLKAQYAALGQKNAHFFSQRPADDSFSPQQRMQNQLDDMLKKGYLVKDKEDYVVSITREQGVIKANGVVIPMPAAAPVSAPAPKSDIVEAYQ